VRIVEQFDNPRDGKAARLERESTYDWLGVRPVVNACGIYTDLGGSRLSPTVWKAMAEVNGRYIDMVELLDRSGVVIADLLGVEAARVTPGASAAIALGVAACMTGGDPARMAQLPDAGDMPNEVILQRGHRYKYARCALLPGARLVEVGAPDRTRPEEIAAAIGPRTAALFVPAHLDGRNGTVPLAEVAAIGRAAGVPTLVDAAYLNEPAPAMGRFIAAGADLVCFSAKYFGGPNAGGFICGRADLIAAVAGVDFTRHESGPYRRFGRAFKLDRHAVVATTRALREWFAEDPADRWRRFGERASTLAAGLADLPGATLTPMCFTMDERLVASPVNSLVVRFPDAPPGFAAELAADLAAGNPSIRCIVEGDALVLVAETLDDDEIRLIANRLTEVATARAAVAR
jgi:L-seryl-tRNA(Ser) seleniumtransferase